MPPCLPRPGKKWHKRCFTCTACKKGLDSSTLGEHEGDIYCKSCHGKLFGPKGFGYGTLRMTASPVASPSHRDAAAAPAPAPVSEGGPPQDASAVAETEEAAPVADKRPSVVAATATATPPRATGADVCPRCGKKAYLAERVLAVGASWHKACMTCQNCHKGLESTTITDREGEIYCKACYGKLFGPKVVEPARHRAPAAGTATNVLGRAMRSPCERACRALGTALARAHCPIRNDMSLRE